MADEPEDLSYWTGWLDQLSHLDMARLWLFAVPGHIVFKNPTLLAHFQARFDAYGGMTPEIHKRATRVV